MVFTPKLTHCLGAERWRRAAVMMRVNLPHHCRWLTDRSLIANGAWQPFQLLVFDWWRRVRHDALCAWSPLAVVQWWAAVCEVMWTQSLTGRTEAEWVVAWYLLCSLPVCCCAMLLRAGWQTLALHRLKCSYIIAPSQLACSRPVSQNASEQQRRHQSCCTQEATHCTLHKSVSLGCPDVCGVVSVCLLFLILK